MIEGGGVAQDAADILAYILRADPDQAPRLLRLYANDLPPVLLRTALSAVWTGCDIPGLYGTRWWLRAFRRAGYTGNRMAPAAPLEVYWGCPAGVGARGMLWTEDLERARRVALRNAAFGFGAAVYRAEVGPEHVLARFADERGENEVVVDPSGLRGITLLEQAEAGV